MFASSTMIGDADLGLEPEAIELGRGLEGQLAFIWWRLMREVPSGLSRAAASVLVTLRDEGPQRVTALATHENVTQPTMSTLIRRLERRGLVVRKSDAADRRACLVEVTDEGRVVMRARELARSRWLAEQLSTLSAAEREQVALTLKLLERALQP
jgi:DNA-binding MarR family transcriptional regulator